MKKGRKDTSFLKLPQLLGGKKSFSEFVKENLQYPPQALKNNIHGTVYIEYRVNENGIVTNAKITKGLGYGCDEEALRIIYLLKFDKVKNKGLRVSSRNKARINFKLPANPVNINYTATKNDTKNQKTYSYTISLEKK